MAAYHYRQGYQGVNLAGPDLSTRRLLAATMSAIDWLENLRRADPALVAATQPDNADVLELRRAIAALLEELS